ncbi:MAG TPA: hypothetical protein VKK79_23890 [Candidatus Lokiarchaeia archaeon]|nr:hypothetical protein [Candidatus Lokiarchaeia archaeon]
MLAFAPHLVSANLAPILIAGNYIDANSIGFPGALLSVLGDAMVSLANLTVQGNAGGR